MNFIIASYNKIEGNKLATVCKRMDRFSETSIDENNMYIHLCNL